jgi:hypothetical protein
MVLNFPYTGPISILEIQIKVVTPTGIVYIRVIIKQNYRTPSNLTKGKSKLIGI